VPLHDIDLYAANARFECEACGHTYEKKIKPNAKSVQVCERCFKRKAVIIERLTCVRPEVEVPRTESSALMKRNLIYSCGAFQKSNEWKRNIEQINGYADIFNGRRIVIIMTGEGIVDPATVEAAFTFEAEFIRCTNVPELREVVGFTEALARLKSEREDEITFFAHTKGVTHDDPVVLDAVRVWRDKMYELCLHNMELIEAVLSQFACAGSFQICEPRIPLPLDSMWHYSGTFWWVNHAKLFSKEWYNVHPSSHGVEAYLGRLFEINETYCLEDSHLDASELYTAGTLGR